MDARRFSFISFGILCLALAYHLGATRTEAQGGPQFTGIALDFNLTPYAAAITSTGDVYVRKGWPNCDGSWSGSGMCDWAYAGNVLGGPVPVEAQSFGSIKAKHR